MDLFDRDDKELIRQVQFGKISIITGPVSIMKASLGIVPTKESNVGTKQIDSVRALKLYRAIKARGGADHRKVKDFWATAFAIHRVQKTIDMKRVDLVLEWMEHGTDGQKVRWVNGPERLFDSLERLEEMVTQHQLFPPHPKTKEILTRLMQQSYLWPMPVTKEDIETFLSNSLACQYAVYMYLKNTEKRKFKRLGSLFPYSDDFVEHWYEITAEMGNSWSAFSGPLTKWAITLTSKRYRNEIVAIIAPLMECSRFEAEKAWDEIVEGVLDAQK